MTALSDVISKATAAERREDPNTLMESKKREIEVLFQQYREFKEQSAKEIKEIKKLKYILETQKTS